MLIFAHRKNIIMKYFLLLSIGLLCFSCSKSISEIALEQDEEIMNYVADNNLDAIRTNEGLYIIIDQEGNGVFPSATSDVAVEYSGRFLDGTVFDANDTEFNLQGVISGWTLGIPYFSEGGKGMLIIPSNLGYGDSKIGSIPANSILLFDIHLKEVL